METTKLDSKVKKDIAPKCGEPARENGLLIDYEWCTGCHACEVACQRELGLEPGEFGITVFEFGPRTRRDNGEWEWSFLPMPTKLCNLCAERTEQGKLPSCVHHCNANVMYFGPTDELAQKMKDKPTQVLYSL